MAGAPGGFCEGGSRAWGHPRLAGDQGQRWGLSGGHLLPPGEVGLRGRASPSHTQAPCPPMSQTGTHSSAGGRPGGHTAERGPARASKGAAVTAEPPNSLSQGSPLPQLRIGSVGPRPRLSGPDPNWTTRLSFSGHETPRGETAVSTRREAAQREGQGQASRVTHRALSQAPAPPPAPPWRASGPCPAQDDGRTLPRGPGPSWAGLAPTGPFPRWRGGWADGRGGLQGCGWAGPAPPSPSPVTILPPDWGVTFAISQVGDLGFRPKVIQLIGNACAPAELDWL